ncbi:MAG TPA: condensation domain-containing protein, partial [Thermoanaerobaculia bacterium]|nr:condensation domain-containing protein [Thermoanaerobaculia bacterium]
LLSERLPEYMVPSSFVLLDRLPLTANGKLDRRALPQPETGEGEEGATIEDPLEELIAGIWQEVLGLPRVGTTVSFFELGGHSLLATQVISRLKSSFGVDVPLRALFANPTVAGLAVALKAALAGRQGGTEPVLSAPRRQPGQDLPASFAQERLWFLACLAPGSTVYNMPAGLHLLGPLSPRELARALTGLVARHEALRTTFEARDGRPLQRIHPPAAVPLPLVDLSGLEAEGRLERVRELAAREIRRPFDLERGPLLRATLVRMAPAEHALLLSQHHIVSDGWSIGVLLADLGRLLRLGRGEAAALPELALQYADFALWQRERLQGEALESLLGAWRKRLSGAPPWLELPLDRPRPALQTFHGASFSFELPAPLGNRLEAFARERQATAYMVLLAVFATLLERLSGARDLLIGSPIANRNRAEIEHLVGFFVNTLVMRLRPRPERSLDELSAEVRATTLDAYAHQDLPFERLVEELAPERNPAVSPLFQVMFAVQNALRRPPELPGLEVRRLGRRSTTAMFDLALTFEPLEGRWAGRLVYNTDLFDGTTAQRLAQAFERLLAGSLTHPERPLGSLPSLSKGERHQLLLEWPAQEVLAPCQASPLIEQQILEQASAMP